MVDLEKIKKREEVRHKQGYYSKESVWFRHQQNVKNDRERAKKIKNGGSADDGSAKSKAPAALKRFF